MIQIVSRAMSVASRTLKLNVAARGYLSKKNDALCNLVLLCTCARPDSTRYSVHVVRSVRMYMHMMSSNAASSYTAVGRTTNKRVEGCVLYVAR